jgi:formylmethanofuran dehydrogenase subunit E
VQAITGCTLGKGNVRVLGPGALSLTLIERATRRAVRVEPRWGAPPPRLPGESAETLFRRLLHAPEKRILSVSREFRYEARAPPSRHSVQRDRRPIDRGQRGERGEILA